MMENIRHRTRKLNSCRIRWPLVALPISLPPEPSEYAGFDTLQAHDTNYSELVRVSLMCYSSLSVLIREGLLSGSELSLGHFSRHSAVSKPVIF